MGWGPTAPGELGMGGRVWGEGVPVPDLLTCRGGFSIPTRPTNPRPKLADREGEECQVPGQGAFPWRL